MTLSFEWDDEKAASNLKNTACRSTRICAIFLDPSRLDRYDAREAYGEDRFLIVGPTDTVVLAVAYAVRDDAIRIISVRNATSHEQRGYWKSCWAHPRSSQPNEAERRDQGPA